MTRAFHCHGARDFRVYNTKPNDARKHAASTTRAARGSHTNPTIRSCCAHSPRESGGGAGYGRGNDWDAARSRTNMKPIGG